MCPPLLPGLQDSFPSGPSRDDSLLAFSSPGLSPDGWPSPDPKAAACPQPPSPEQQPRQRLPGGLGGPEVGGCPQGSLPSVDSGSLSEEEDEVFYN